MYARPEQRLVLSSITLKTARPSAKDYASSDLRISANITGSYLNGCLGIICMTHDNKGDNRHTIYIQSGDVEQKISFSLLLRYNFSAHCSTA